MPILDRISDQKARDNIVSMAGKEDEYSMTEKLTALVHFFGIGMSAEEFDKFSGDVLDDDPKTDDIRFIAQFADMNTILAEEEMFRKFVKAYDDPSVSDEEYSKMQMFIAQKLMEAAGKKANPAANEQLDEVMKDLDKTAKKEDPVFYEQAYSDDKSELEDELKEHANIDMRYIVGEREKEEIEEANKRLDDVIDDLNISALDDYGLVDDKTLKDNSLKSEEKKADNAAREEKDDPEYTFTPFFSDDVFDAESAINACKNKISAIDPKKVLDKNDKNLACDFVIAKMLKKESAKTSFYGHFVTSFNDDMNVEKANMQIDAIRDKMMKDPVFDSVFSNGLTAKDFYGVYMKAVNTDINRRIKVEKNINKELQENASLADRQQEYLDNNYIELTKEERDSISTIRNNLKQFNKGKKPSELMKNLMDSFEVLDTNRKYSNVIMADIDDLNKCALAYYETRQGKVMGPVTDNGKSRLHEVEKLIKVTGSLMAKIRSAKEMQMPGDKGKTTAAGPKR